MSAGIAALSPTIVEEMKAKHPQAPVPPLVPTEEVAPLSLSSDQVLRGIMSFKRGSAPGPSGLRAEHLKVAVKGGLQQAGP